MGIRRGLGGKKGVGRMEKNNCCGAAMHAVSFDVLMLGVGEFDTPALYDDAQEHPPCAHTYIL